MSQFKNANASPQNDQHSRPRVFMLENNLYDYVFSYLIGAYNPKARL